MANNRCQMCGKELPEDVLNCIYCGARLVPKEGLKKSNSIVLIPQNDTDEFIDSLFSDDEQDTKSPSDDLENEISNILDQDGFNDKEDNALPSSSLSFDESSASDLFDDIPDEIMDVSNKGETGTWLNVVFDEDDQIPPEKPDALEENETKENDIEQPQIDEEKLITEEPEKKEDIPEWFSIILDEKENEELIPPPEELAVSQVDETEESFPEEKVTWNEYSTRDKKLKLPEWFTKTNEEKTSLQQDRPPEIKKENLVDKKPESSKKRNPWNWLTGRKKEKTIQKAEEIKSEPTTFEGAATLPGWMPDKEDEEVSHEEDTIVETTETVSFEGTAPLPDGMTEIEETAVLPEEETIVETTEPVPFEGTTPLPDWMGAKDQEETPSEEEAILETTDTPPFEGTAPLPGWMTDKAEEEATPETTEPVPFEGTTPLPDWMVAKDQEETLFEEEAVLETTDTPPFKGTAPLPDWMSDDAEEETPPEEEAILETTDTPSFEGTAPLPGWMTNKAEEEAVPETAETVSFEGTAPLPDWMADDAEEETSILHEEKVFFEQTETPRFEGTAPLPDWMADKDEEEVSHEEEAILETTDTPPFEGTAPFPDSMADDAEEETAILSEKKVFFEQTETPPFEGTAPLPDWLSDEDQEVVPSEEEFTIEPTEPAPFEGTAPLPDWLSDEDQEVVPSEEEFALESTGLAPFEGTTPLPDWITDETEKETTLLPEKESIQNSLDGTRTEDEKEQNFLRRLSEEDVPLEEESLKEDEISIESDSLLLEDAIELPDSFTFEDLPSAEEPLQDSTPEDNIELPEWLEKEIAEFQGSTLPDETVIIDSKFPFEKLGEEAPKQDPKFFPDFGHAIPKLSDELYQFDDFSEEETEDLPQWITKRNEASSFEGNLEQTGPLKGLRGLLPSETIFLQHQQPPTYTSEIKFTDNDSQHAAMMESILTSEKNKRFKLKTHKRDYILNLRLGLTAILVLTIFLGLFFPKNLSANMISNPPTQVVQFYQLLQNNILNSSQKPVLLIIDSQPAHFSELRAYGELPIKSLMESNTRILTFSSNPEGTFLSSAMLKEIISDYQLNYDLDRNVFNIGYLAGGSTALRSFALDMRASTYGLDVGTSGEYIWDQPEIAEIDSIDAFSTIIIMADTVEKAQRWIEQVGTILPDSTQFLFITSAQATPILKAYINTGQIDGLIGSPLDAVAYATLENQINDAILYWNAYRLAIIFMIIVIISGMLYHNLGSFKNFQNTKSGKKMKAGKK